MEIFDVVCHRFAGCTDISTPEFSKWIFETNRTRWSKNVPEEPKWQLYQVPGVSEVRGFTAQRAQLPSETNRAAEDDDDGLPALVSTPLIWI